MAKRPNTPKTPPVLHDPWEPIVERYLKQERRSGRLQVTTWEILQELDVEEDEYGNIEASRRLRLVVQRINQRTGENWWPSASIPDLDPRSTNKMGRVRGYQWREPGYVVKKRVRRQISY